MGLLLRSVTCALLCFGVASSAMFMRTINSRSSERPGAPTKSHSCWNVRGVPGELRSAANMGPSGISVYYQKYTEAYGIPILGSVHVPDNALKRACYVVRFLLADRQDIRLSYYKHFGRFAVYAMNEVTRSIPEHAYLDSYWDSIARGFGASLSAPVATCAEENALCYSSDTFDPNDDVALHEYGHGLQALGVHFAIPGFKSRLKRAYASARSRGLWTDTYSITNEVEYWAKAVQSYFNANTQRASVNKDGPVRTKDDLKNYDPVAYALVQEIFPCNNHYINRCGNSQTLRSQEHAQQLRMNCVATVPVTIPAISPATGTGSGSGSGTGSGSCFDNHVYCKDWSQNGQCSYNKAYMEQNCRKSCNLCSSGTSTSENCADGHVYCKDWSQNGDCSRNKAYMEQNCRKSCNLCSTGVDILENCKDKHAYCTDWTVIGKCSTNKVYMAKHCKKSCDLCAAGTQTESCEDSHTNCKYWAETGVCASNPAYMQQNCRKSCNLCSSIQTGSCADQGTHCQYWSEIGECTRNQGYMAKNCRKSCRLC